MTIEELAAVVRGGAVLVVPRAEVKHPRTWPGAYRSTGLPVGQLENWRVRLDDGSGLHARVFADVIEVHRDSVDPRTSVVRHVFRDVIARMRR